MTVPTPAEIVTRAAAAAASSDFGAETFWEGLEKNLAALDEMPLLPEQRDAAVQRLVDDLALRARIEAWHKANPHAADQPIEGPVLVCGMPRTGTTATVGMFALDDRFRFLRAWEGKMPLPPPVAGEEDRDPRVIAAREAAKHYDKPEMHIHDPDGPEEDIVFWAGLNAHGYHGSYPMPRWYKEWWAQTDFADTYAFYRRVMTMLQSRRPPHRWLMKAPPHLFHLAAFARCFPDTRFVWTHRDPVKVIPSTASLQHRMQAQRCLPGAIDKAESSALLLDVWQEGMRRGLEARATIGEARFLDVRNADVVKHPAETFARIYAHIGMELTPKLRSRLEDYNRRNKPGAFGAHHYTPEEYGLSEDGIRAAFAVYLDRFGV